MISVPDQISGCVVTSVMSTGGFRNQQLPGVPSSARRDLSFPTPQRYVQLLPKAWRRNLLTIRAVAAAATYARQRTTKKTLVLPALCACDVGEARCGYTLVLVATYEHHPLVAAATTRGKAHSEMVLLARTRR